MPALSAAIAFTSLDDTCSVAVNAISRLYYQRETTTKRFVSWNGGARRSYDQQFPYSQAELSVLLEQIQRIRHEAALSLAQAKRVEQARLESAQQPS